MNAKSILKKLGIAGLTAFVVAIGFFAGLYVNAKNVSITVSESQKPLDLALFWRALSLLDEKYVPNIATSTPATAEEKLYGAIKGLAESYGDPYTTFLSPKESKSLTSDLSGSLEGIGAVLAIKNDVLTVVSVLKASPAERTGLLAGDRIIKVYDESTNGITVEEAVGKIRGAKGTTVSLTIDRDGLSVPFTVDIVRDTISNPVVETVKHPGSVFVIKVGSFTSNLSDLFRNALREYRESGYTKLVIDLRNNTGGYLDSAVDMASWFLPAGKPVVTEDFGGKAENLVYRSRGYSFFPDGQRIVVLVNEYSASASEIFAGALRDHGKAILVGERTFGKGSVQELVPLTDDTLLKVTIARWLTPSGTSISNNGLVPDFAVGLGIDDIKAGKDPQLDKALEIARKL